MDPSETNSVKPPLSPPGRGSGVRGGTKPLRIGLDSTFLQRRSDLFRIRSLIYFIGSEQKPISRWAEGWRGGNCDLSVNFIPPHPSPLPRRGEGITPNSPFAAIGNTSALAGRPGLSPNLHPLPEIATMFHSFAGARNLRVREGIQMRTFSMRLHKSRHLFGSVILPTMTVVRDGTKAIRRGRSA